MTAALNKNLESFEYYLNFAGHYPIFSIASGGFRVNYGIIQTTAAAATTALGLVGSIFSRILNNTKVPLLAPSLVDLQGSCDLTVKTSYPYIRHGIANFARGLLEMSCVCGTILKDFDSKPENRFSYSPVA